MDQRELESLASAKDPSPDAAFVLGKLMIEGTSDKIPVNEKKGLQWVKQAIEAGSIDALEYKTYYDIRWDSSPNLDKIMENLTLVIGANKSCKALNIMGELAHTQASAAVDHMDPKVK